MFLQLDGYSGGYDESGNEIEGRQVYIIKYDATNNKILPFGTKYNVGFTVWYMKG